MANDNQPQSPDEETGVKGVSTTNTDPLVTNPPEGGIVKEPSRRLNPSVTPEDEERMAQELTPTHVIGPPGYASPDPATSAGKLVEVEDHPLSGDISEDYGANVAAPAEEPASSALAAGGAASGEVDEEEMTKDELQAEAEKRGLPTSGTKAEIAERIREDDEAADNE